MHVTFIEMFDIKTRCDVYSHSSTEVKYRSLTRLKTGLYAESHESVRQNEM